MTERLARIDISTLLPNDDALLARKTAAIERRIQKTYGQEASMRKLRDDLSEKPRRGMTMNGWLSFRSPRVP